MKSGHRIVWTDNALDELRRTLHYLESSFSEKEINRLANKIESVLRNISKYPELYPETIERDGVRRAVVAKFNTMYYRVNISNDQI